MLALAACFRDHDDVTKSALTQVTQNPKAKSEYFTDTIVMMWVAKDAVDADILVNDRGTSISRALCDAAFCKPLYKSSDSFALDSEY